MRGLVSVYDRPIIAGVRILIVSSTCSLHDQAPSSKDWSCETKAKWRRKDFLIGVAQFETTYRVVSNLYNNL